MRAALRVGHRHQPQGPEQGLAKSCTAGVLKHLSSLPRGTGSLGFYEKEEEHVPILSVRLGNEAKDVAAFEYLFTESESFAAFADARANRRDPFFIRPAGGADICNIPVPIRRKVGN